jgi:hypothetical protein
LTSGHPTTTRDDPQKTTTWWALRWKRDVPVFAGFALVSFGLFGSAVLPHPGRVILGGGPDNAIFVWSFAWWPHALLSGTNPFVTHLLYAPSGANLTWMTSVPGLALVFAPVTLVFGPVVSFNFAALLLPALAAFACYRLCFALTRSLWASLIGGYLYGFSSFILAQQILAHVFLTADFVLPLIALAIVHFIREDWSRRRFAAWLGLLLAIQLLISTEVALTLTLMLVISLGLALLLVVDARPRVRALVPAVAAGYGLGAVFAMPFVVFVLLGWPSHGFVRDPAGTDPLNLLVPTNVNALAGTALPSVQGNFNPHESAIFVGLPVLIIAGLFTWRTWRSGWTRFLIAGFLAALVLALGPKLTVAGAVVGPLPWRLLENVRGFEDIHTPRFGVYAGLVAAVIVALWTARTRGWFTRRPLVLPILAVVTLLPAVWRPLPVVRPDRPAFFAARLYKRCFPAHETLLIFPFAGDDLDVLQAETGFSFAVAGGYLTPTPAGVRSIVSFNNDPTVGLLEYWSDRGVPSIDALRAFAARHGVDRVVSIAGDGYPTSSQLRAFGPVEEIGGVEVAPACGRPSLAGRPLPAGARRMLAQQRRGQTTRYCLDGYTYDLPAGLEPGGTIAGATRAVFVAGHGLACSAPPGYTHHGYAPPTATVPSDTYLYYTR